MLILILVKNMKMNTSTFGACEYGYHDRNITVFSGTGDDQNMDTDRGLVSNNHTTSLIYNNSEIDHPAENEASVVYNDNDQNHDVHVDAWNFCGFYQNFDYINVVSTAEALSVAEKLRINRWIDEATRSVSLKIIFYISNYNRWIVVDLKYFVSLSGQVIPIGSNHDALQIELLNANSVYGISGIILSVIFVTYICFITIGICSVYRFNYHRKHVVFVIDKDEKFNDIDRHNNNNNNNNENQQNNNINNNINNTSN